MTTQAVLPARADAAPTATSEPGRRVGVSRAVRTLVGWHRPLAWFALAMVGAGVVSLIGYALDPRTLAGSRIWAKPLKFDVSLALYAATLAWMTSMIDPRRRRLAWLAGTVGAVAGLLEILLITLQVVRGTSSHFNVSTPIDAAVYGLMGFGVVFLYSATLVIGLMLSFSSRIADRALRWALRLGLAIGVGGLSVGFLMVIPTAAQRADPGAGTIGSHSVSHGDTSDAGLPFLGWSTHHGDLRVAHFVGMHALQLIPLLALALSVYGPRLAAGTRVRIVALAAAVYASITGLVLWQALRGQSVLDVDAASWTAIAVVALLVAAYAGVLVRRFRGDMRSAGRPIPVR